MSAETREIPAGLDASVLRIAIVHSAFNHDITSGLLAGARELLGRAGAGEVTVVEAPGAFELPLFAQRLVAAGHDAVIALGAVVLGETDHYEHVAHRASEGLMRVMLDSGVPVAFGILTTRDREAAVARSAPGPANKGAEAALAAIEAALALRRLSAR